MDMAVEDEALARLSANGDRDAFARLVERHYDRIFRIAPTTSSGRGRKRRMTWSARR